MRIHNEFILLIIGFYLIGCTTHEERIIHNANTAKKILQTKERVPANENAENAESTETLAEEYHRYCLENIEYVVNQEYKVDCHANFHHYNTEAEKKFYDPKNGGSEVMLAGLNTWHPGQDKTRFHDFALMAKVLNQWDVIGATELVSVQGPDLEHNQRVIKFIAEGPELLAKKKEQVKELTERASLTPIQNDRLSLLQSELLKLKSDLGRITKLYRKPGYLRILDELMKLDPSWSLILSPIGEGGGETKELVGFYYRSSKVTSLANEYCEEHKENKSIEQPLGCTPNFTKEFMGRDTSKVFSRKPFMANFESGKFKFTFMASHVVYNSPDPDKEPERSKEILTQAFQTENLKKIKPKLAKFFYARFAEVQVMIEFMQKLREKYKVKDIILTGDLNLEASHKYWAKALSKMPGADVYITEPTSLSKGRLRKFQGNKVKTYGYTSNYDHFILDRNETKECASVNDSVHARHYDIYKDGINKDIEKKYIIRNDFLQEGEKNYTLDQSRESLMNELLQEYKTYLKTVETVSNNKIVFDPLAKDDELEMKRRLFDTQMADATYYNIFSEVFSDHIPVYMKCRK